MTSLKWTRTVLVAALAGCAGVQGSESTGGVVLGPGGHAEGRVIVAAGGETRLELSIRGTGRADFAVRDAAGAVLQQGALGTSETRIEPARKTTLTVSLDARGDGPATVEYVIRGPETDVTWDLSRAAGTPAAPKQ